MHCPLCNANDNRPMQTIEVEKVLRDWKLQFGIDVSKEFGDLRAIDLIKCRECELRYFDSDGIEGSSDLYAELNRLEWYYASRKWEHDVALPELRRRKRILEIGCGVGHFVARARVEEGLNIEGIELNDTAVTEAERQGLPVRLLDLHDAAKLFPEQYDAVCAFQVLEHVADPKAFLEQCCALIKPGGILILGLPNAESFLKHQYCLLDMPPHHSTRWSMRTLMYLPNILPLKLKNLKREPLAEHHVGEYLDAHSSHLVARYPRLRRVWRPNVRDKVRRLIRQTHIRNLLVGHTICASFERL